MLQIVSSLERSEDEDYDETYDIIGGGYVEGGGIASASGRLSSLHSVCGLLRFYRGAARRTVTKASLPRDEEASGSIARYRDPSTNPLAQCIIECLAEAVEVHSSCLRALAANIVKGMESAGKVDDDIANENRFGANVVLDPLEVTPTAAAADAIIAICNQRRKSPGFGPGFDDKSINREIGSDDQREGISSDDDPEDPVVTAALSITTVAANLLGASLVPVPPTCSHHETVTDGTVALATTNLSDAPKIRSALVALRGAGLPPSEASDWDAALTKREEWAVNVLVSYTSQNILETCGLRSILNSVRVATGQDSCLNVESEERDGEDDKRFQRFADLPGLSGDEVSHATKSFYECLGGTPVPTFADVGTDPALARAMRDRTADAVANAYRELYNALTGPKGGYQNKETLVLSHHPERVKELLSA